MSDRRTPSRVLVTGASGRIGRVLVRELVRRGKRVTVLVNPGGSRWNGNGRGLMGGNGSGRGVENELSADLATVRARDLLGLLDGVDEIWHLAAVTDLVTSPRRLHAVNVCGTEVLLQVARCLRVTAFHYVSTAYVANGGMGAARECDLPPPDAEHRSRYEVSKRIAEGLVRAETDRGLPCVIYRPSIVVGDWGTGVMDRPGAFDGLFRVARGFANRTMAVPGHPESSVNVVPRDRVVRAMLELAVLPNARGMTFHLTNPAPPTLSELVEITRRFVRGLRVAFRGREEIGGPVRRWRFLASYLNGPPAFDRSNLEHCLGGEPLVPAQGQQAWLMRVVEHIVNTPGEKFT